MLTHIIGQPALRHVRAWLANPTPRCWLLEGAGGVGKTMTAQACAEALGATRSCWDTGGFFLQKSTSEFTIDTCRELFERTLRYSYPAWKVVIIEELDKLASPAVLQYLKVALEDKNLPSKTAIFATSNDCSKLDKPFRQRFSYLVYSNGPHFAEACNEHIAKLWAEQTNGEPLPFAWDTWGSTGDGFSMRLAMRRLEDELACVAMEVAA